MHYTFAKQAQYGEMRKGGKEEAKKGKEGKWNGVE